MLFRFTGRRLVLAAVVGLLAAGVGWGQAPQESAPQRVALLADIEGPIGPATVRHVEKVVEAARERAAEVLILRLNTPGGLATSMREIIAEILGSTVPVAGYVAPSGAHAASAGTYILYATHVAAMAPATNIGAATPVQIGGGFPGMPSPEDRERGDGKESGGDERKDAKDGESKPAGEGEKTDDAAEPPGDAMKAKAVNDAVAFIRGLAEMHGRNADWAERAVREAATLSARPALEQNVIEIVAPDVEALLAQMHGRTVTAGSEERTLDTEGIAVERFEKDIITEALGVLSNPNVAFILLMIGVYGLIFEFSNPGTIGPGVVGVICLVLGLYALNQLPLNYAGLALLGLGIAFMIAEAVTPAFGAFGVGGLVAFVIGAAMLIDTEAPAYQLSWWVIGSVAATSGLVLILLLGYLWRVYRRPRAGGAARLVGTEGQVLDWSGGEGHVWAHGERWFARGDASLAEGEPVRIRELDGLTLIVGHEPGEAETEPDDRNDKGA